MSNTFKKIVAGIAFLVDSFVIVCAFFITFIISAWGGSSSCGLINCNLIQLILLITLVFWICFFGLFLKRERHLYFWLLVIPALVVVLIQVFGLYF